MKITVESKFEVEQGVFWITGNGISKLNVSSIFLRDGRRVWYTLSGMAVCVSEEELYATYQEAYAVLYRQIKANLTAAIQQIKRDARSIAHNYTNADCMDDATLLSAKRLIRKLDRELGEILKGGKK